jgi:SHS2 domain-containing protein
MSRPPRGYASFEHTADLGLEAWGGSLAALLEEVVAGLAALIADPRTVSPAAALPLDITADDREELLVALANEALFYLDSEAFLPKSAELNAGEEGGRFFARGRLLGERYDPARHRTFTEVKSATYAGLAVREEGGVFSARVILDV